VGNPRYANGHRRRQLRARVLARDSRCWLCGKTVDKSLGRLHPLAPEVHEILPVSRGGDPLSLENTTLCHRACNNWIGNRTPAELANVKKPDRGQVRTGINW
jgi:hypothetical protein